MDKETEEFLAHYGVKGMKWGVRRDRRLQRQSNSIDKRTKKGKAVKSMASESKRVQDAGGGLKGTLNVRKEMIRSGELAKEQAQAGRNKFARNVLIGVVGAAAVGTAVGMLSGRSLSNPIDLDRAAERVYSKVKESRENKAKQEGMRYISQYLKENPAAELLTDPLGRPFIRETKVLLKEFKYKD